MAEYTFSGDHAAFPGVRAAMGQDGVVILSTCTRGNILHVETEQPLSDEFATANLLAAWVPPVIEAAAPEEGE